MGALRAGLIPGKGDFFFLNDDDGASCKARALMRARSTKPKGSKQTRLRAQNAKPEGAKRLRMRMQSTKPEGSKRPRIRAQNAKPEGAKRPSQCAGMSAANVGASFL